jgi:hypothetical protein
VNKDASSKQHISPAARVPETLAELQKVLKDNAEALRENAEALRRICELTADSDLPKIKMGGGKPKVLFDQGLKYVTGQEKRRVALTRFRKFLAGDGEYSEQQIDEFLLTRADRWPGIRRDVETDELVVCGPHLPGGVSTYLDYGGFLLEELETLKVVYQSWWARQMNAKRRENLPSRKKRKEEKPA